MRAFDSGVHQLNEFAPRVSDLLRQLLAERGIRVHTVEARVKERSSLARKVKEHEPPYASLRDVTDVLGARIITYFPDDVDIVGRLIEEEFAVDHANSNDPRASIDPRHFGYSSLHRVVALSPAREALPEWAPLAGWRFEIQIRTILQHAWAEIEHDRGFHTESDVPAHVRRRWSRVAALLETADLEFATLRDLATSGVEVGQQRPGISSPEEEFGAISSVAVTSAGSVVPGNPSAGISISIVVTEPPRTMKRRIRVRLETPDVTFTGTPAVASRSNVVAQVEPDGRAIAIDLVGGTREQASITVSGLGLAAGPGAPSGPVQASVAVDQGNRRPIASLGTIGHGAGILVAVRDVPTLRAGGHNQIAGRIAIVEVAAGSLMSGVVLRLRLVDMPDTSSSGATFETAPLMVVRHGDIRLRDGAAPSPANAVRATVDANDPSCVEWAVWMASTVPSTLEVGDAGALTGPRIALGLSHSAVGLQVETVDREGNVRAMSLTVLGFPAAGK